MYLVAFFRAFMLWLKRIQIYQICFLCIFLVSIFSKIGAQTVSFNVNPVGGNYCVPAKIQFQPKFSETPLSFYWQFGTNYEESELNNPTFIYTTPGKYKVTLVALFKNSIQSFDKTIEVFGLPDLDIKADKYYLCKTDTIQFSSEGTVGIQNINWDFGDGTFLASNGFEPTYNNYTAFGTYSVQAVGTDNHGCKASSSLQIRIVNPPGFLIDTPQLGCLPATVTLSARVTVPSGSQVKEYVWDFGDGSPILTNRNSKVVHIYTDTFTYKPTLSITTSEGCTNSYKFGELSFARKPEPFSISTAKTTICASELPYFFVSPYDSGNQYHWFFGDGDSINTVDSFAIHQYKTLGNFDVKVVSVKNECSSDTSGLTIMTQGVVASFALKNQCNNKSLFNFRNTSQGLVNSIQWSFGHGNDTSGVTNIFRQYPSVGEFPVSMIVYNIATDCADTAYNTVYTAIPKLIPMDTFVCRNGMAEMWVEKSYSSNRAKYRWILAGKRIDNTDSTVSTIATIFGTFSNYVVIDNGSEYCNDTLLQALPVRVGGPTAKVNIPPILCIDQFVNFTDGTTAFFPENEIEKWNWNFGNSTFSSLQNPVPLKYQSPSRYQVSLEVEDNSGCIDSTKASVIIRRSPLLLVIPENQKICSGQSFQLNAFHKSSIKWLPSNEVDCDSCDQVMIKPVKPTTYTVLATDQFGCQSQRSANIDTWMPFELSTLLKDTAICIGNSVFFDLNLNDKIISWSPSEGMSNLYISNPTISPAITTIYTATISDSAFCFFQNTSSTIKVNPLPIVSAGQDSIVGFNKPFTLNPVYGPDIVKYQWSPKHLLDCFDCSKPSGIASVSTLFSVVATTSHGCVDSSRVSLTIECTPNNINMPTAFTPDNNKLNDYYYPLTRGIKLIKKFVIYNRLGRVVFERANFIPNENILGWDGKFKGEPQPSGGFVYFVEVVCDGGSIINKKGSFVLLR